MFRWADPDHAGTDHGLAIDNFSLAWGASIASLYWDTNGALAGLGGSGVWNAFNSNWTENANGDGPVTQYASASPVIFAGVAGEVTIDVGGITAEAGLRFDTPEYSIGGATLTLNTVTTINTAHDAGTATTIQSEIAGDGLTKAGPGTLILSGANTFDGPVVLSGGALQISAKENLGIDANDVSFGGGTLLVTESMFFAATRDLSGSGAIDVATGKTLTVDGSTDLGSLALSGDGTLFLNGGTRTVGAISFSGAGTLAGIGEITATTITTTHTTGTATISADVNLGSNATRAITVTDGSAAIDLELAGDLTLAGGGSSRFHKLGTGTLLLGGDNSGLAGSVRIGTAGGVPAPGGTVIITNNLALGSDPSLQVQFNDGVLESTANLTGANAIPLGLSIGAGQGVPATFAGEDMEFTGTVSLFGASAGYTFAIRVENTTTFSGPFETSTGNAGTGGLNITGDGTLVIAAATNALDEAIVVNGPTLAVNGALTATAATILIDQGTLTGGGSIAGDVTVTDGAFLAPGDGAGTLTFGGNLTFSGLAGDTGALKFELGAVGSSDSAVLTSGFLTLGAGLSFSDFDFTTTAGFGEGTYVLFDTGNAIAGAPAGPLSGFVGGFESTIEVSGTDLVLNVVPEPGTATLLLGGLGLMAARRRRR